MYWKLLLAYSVAFVIIGGYLLHLRQQISRLESRLDDSGL